jgi:hypothetical protein
MCVSPVKPTRRAAQSRAGSSNAALLLQRRHVALDPPKVSGAEYSTSAWCREQSIDEDKLVQQIIDMINVSRDMKSRYCIATLSPLTLLSVQWMLAELQFGAK